MEMEVYPKALFSIPISSIVWMEGDGNYTRVHLLNGRMESLPYTLKMLGTKLPDFVRVHKSSLINPLYVQDLRSRGYRDYYIRLSSGHTLSVSRKRVSMAANKLNLSIPDS